ANRLLARRARRVCLAFAIPGLDSERYLVTGRPVPAAIAEADRAAARERYGMGADERCLLGCGGSQGALSINRCARDAFVGGVPRAYRRCLSLRRASPCPTRPTALPKRSSPPSEP